MSEAIGLLISATSFTRQEREESMLVDRERRARFDVLVIELGDVNAKLVAHGGGRRRGDCLLRWTLERILWLTNRIEVSVLRRGGMVCGAG